jgi:hypothetical protein
MANNGHLDRAKAWCLPDEEVSGGALKFLKVKRTQVARTLRHQETRAARASA